MAFCSLCWVGESVGRSRIRRAAVLYWPKASTSRLRVLEASAIWVWEGGLSGSLYTISLWSSWTMSLTDCRIISSCWNFGSISRMPLSNWMRFSYARTSGGLYARAAAKSLLLKTVALHSLHILTSTPTCPTAFSVLLSVTEKVSQDIQRVWD